MHDEFKSMIRSIIYVTETNDVVVPKALCIQKANISHAGDQPRLHELCKNVCEADLDKNSLTHWSEVTKCLTGAKLIKIPYVAIYSHDYNFFL